MNQFKVIGKSRCTKGSKSMSEDSLLSALIESKYLKESEKNFDDAKIENSKKDFNKLRDRFSKPKTNEIRKGFYEIENKQTKKKFPEQK